MKQVSKTKHQAPISSPAPTVRQYAITAAIIPVITSLAGSLLAAGYLIISKNGLGPVDKLAQIAGAFGVTAVSLTSAILIQKSLLSSRSGADDAARQAVKRQEHLILQTIANDVRRIVGGGS